MKKLYLLLSIMFITISCLSQQGEIVPRAIKFVGNNWEQLFSYGAVQVEIAENVFAEGILSNSFLNFDRDLTGKLISNGVERLEKFSLSQFKEPLLEYLVRYPTRIGAQIFRAHPWLTSAGTIAFFSFLYICRKNKKACEKLEREQLAKIENFSKLLQTKALTSLDQVSKTTAQNLDDIDKGLGQVEQDFNTQATSYSTDLKKGLEDGRKAILEQGKNAVILGYDALNQMKEQDDGYTDFIDDATLNLDQTNKDIQANCRENKINIANLTQANAGIAQSAHDIENTLKNIQTTASQLETTITAHHEQIIRQNEEIKAHKEYFEDKAKVVNGLTQNIDDQHTALNETTAKLDVTMNLLQEVSKLVNQANDNQVEVKENKLDSKEIIPGSNQ